MELSEQSSPIRVPLRIETAGLPMGGSYRLCSALFESGSNPNLISNCYWSEVAGVEKEQTASGRTGR
jgi:hypothetical protein